MSQVIILAIVSLCSIYSAASGITSGTSTHGAKLGFKDGTIGTHPTHSLIYIAVSASRLILWWFPTIVMCVIRILSRAV